MSNCKEELEKISKRINERAQAILDQNGVIFENEIDAIAREEFGCESPYMMNHYSGMKEQKLECARSKFRICEELHKLGYEYRTRLWDDGTVCTHKFIRPDCMRDECYWEVAIEDHTDDDGEDWLIFVRYHDPDQKDWDGHQIDISGCVEFEAMKLIVEFTEILKKGETNGK